MINFIRSLFLIIIIGYPKIVTACATCYGAPDAPATQGLNMAILVLLAFTASMLSLIIFNYIILQKVKKVSLRSKKNIL